MVRTRATVDRDEGPRDDPAPARGRGRLGAEGEPEVLEEQPQLGVQIELFHRILRSIGMGMRDFPQLLMLRHYRMRY